MRTKFLESMFFDETNNKIWNTTNLTSPNKYFYLLGEVAEWFKALVC